MKREAPQDTPPTNHREVWTLLGIGRDFWESFEIVEGFVCPRTGRAYWVHASSEGGRVLTTGTFVVNHNKKDSSSFSSCCSLTQASWISNQAWCKRVTPYLSFEFVRTLPHDDDKNPQDKDSQNRSMTTTTTTTTTRTTNSGGTSATTAKAIIKNATTTSRTPTTRPPVPAQISYPGTSRVVARCSTTPPHLGNVVVALLRIRSGSIHPSIHSFSSWAINKPTTEDATDCHGGGGVTPKRRRKRRLVGFGSENHISVSLFLFLVVVDRYDISELDSWSCRERCL